MRSILTCILALVLSSFSASPAWAEDAASCDLLEIKASKDGTKMDPELGPLQKKLSKPPFSSWTAFSLLKRHTEAVSRMKAAVVKLVPGSQVSLVYLGSSKETGKKDRLRLEFTLDDNSGKRIAKATLAVDAGDYYAVVGDSLGGGAHHILAVACRSN
jgi:hypothetical protein